MNPVYPLLALSSMTLMAGEVTISGLVHLDGPRPKREPITLTPESRKQYKAPPLSEVKLVGPKGGVSNVFVYIKDGLPQGKSYEAPSDAVLLNQVKSMFRPRVQGVLVGQDFIMRNSDPVIHNVRSLSDENRSFNIGQPANTPDRKKVFRDPEHPIEMRCDFHPWMRAFVFAMDHPFFAVTNEQGRFEIKDVPAGKYTLAIWHEAYGRKKQDITIKSQVKPNITFALKPQDAKNQNP